MSFQISLGSCCSAGDWLCKLSGAISCFFSCYVISPHLFQCCNADLLLNSRNIWGLQNVTSIHGAEYKWLNFYFGFGVWLERFKVTRKNTLLPSTNYLSKAIYSTYKIKLIKCFVSSVSLGNADLWSSFILTVLSCEGKPHFLIYP